MSHVICILILTYVLITFLHILLYKPVLLSVLISLGLRDGALGEITPYKFNEILFIGTT